ncbi:MAG: hypothetical protein KDC46_04615 [Thermoleophilia bacterium]|nr:hypothetical protein [Thermoleophilia bacterium]
MNISAEGRAIAEQVIDSARSFASGLDQAIANNGAGVWQPGPLWDNAILSMRTQAGGLAQNLEFMKLLGADVFEHLPAELGGQLDDQLLKVKRILDEIHTDQGGQFADHLTDFRTFGDDVATQLEQLLKKADEAEAEAAANAVQGAKVLSWELEDAGTEVVRETRRAAENVNTKAAGAG